MNVDGLITRREAAKMLNETYIHTYKLGDFPKPVSKEKHVKYYTIESIEQYMSNRFNPDIEYIKKLNNQGLTRLEMAKVLNVTKAVITGYCFKRQIMSMRTRKSGGSKAIFRKPIDPKTALLNSFLFQHCHAVGYF